MNVSIFNKKYKLRRFEEQHEVKGYLVASYTDRTVCLHIHPSGSDSLTANPEGERVVKKLEGHGTCPLVVANADANIKGDLIWYQGSWYECISSQLYDNTMLSHYNYLFVKVPMDGSRENDIRNPP